RGGDDRRRLGWREFRRAYPGVLAVLGVVLAVLLVADGFLIQRRSAYAAETTRLRESMTTVERERTDLILAADERRWAVMLELARRQARADQRLHLSVAVDSGTLTLERDGARLRLVRAEVGGVALVGSAPDTVRLAAPRGERTIEAVLGANDSWLVPDWVYVQRGLPVPPDSAARSVAGALGATALVLTGGTVIYALPATGPLAEPSYVLPGSVRLPAADLEAMRPNLSPGMSVYFY
ncbi:MAG: hypothetical protein ACYC2G_01105, partial [Gemmatimonadaceae bacterium]